MIALLAIAYSPLLVAAHSPASMALEYDFGAQILTVTISHSVTDPATHYVENITVYNNDVKVTSRLYTAQASTTTASDTITVTAANGDELRVWAECVQGGTVQQTLTVSDATTTTTTDGDFPTTLIILGGVVAILVVAVIFKLSRR
jgi:hypothetical protein